MNDLDLVRDMRADVPEPTAARLAVGRARVTAAIGSRPVRVTPRSRLVGLNHPVIAGVLAVAVAAVTVVAVGVGTARQAARGRPAAVKAPVLTLTARVLRAAASVTARDRAAQPRPGQWFYRDLVSYQFGQHPATGSDPEWATFDGQYSAYYAGPGGPLIVHESPAPLPRATGTALDQFNNDATPLTAYRALASLPASPKAVLAVVAAQVNKIGAANLESGSPLNQYVPTSRGQLDFDYLTLLMWNATDGEPPATEARVYEALADMPGVTVQPGITDAAGQPAIGISDDGGIEQLLVSPRTFAVIGMRQVSTGVSPARQAGKAAMLRRLGGKLRAVARLPWPPKGALVVSLAIAQVHAVSGPGVR
jgi:hypothetical protein